MVLLEFFWLLIALGVFFLLKKVQLRTSSLDLRAEETQRIQTGDRHHISEKKRCLSLPPLFLYSPASEMSWWVSLGPTSANRPEVSKTALVIRRGICRRQAPRALCPAMA